MQLQLVLIWVLCLTLTACGGSTPSNTQTPTTAAKTPTTAAKTPTTAAKTPTTAATTTSATKTTDTSSTPSSGDVITYAIVPTESRVAYEVGEVFINQNNKYNVAMGITQEITGEIQLDLTTPKNSLIGPITVNIQAFKSDSTRRDNAIREKWLESTRFPIATFTTTSIEGLPETYTMGTEIELTIKGDLTLREVTKPVTFTLKGKLANEEMTGTAVTNIKMSDFGFEAPNILEVLRAEDAVKLTFTFIARPNA